MKRRLNYTNRRTLSSDHIIISLDDQGLGLAPKFNAQINIPIEWNLNPAAKIYIEAYVVSTSMRFSFGTVGEIEHPINTTLDDIDTGNILFRAKIVDESGEVGMLLASADEIRAKNQNDDSDATRAFFPLVLAPLDQAIWSVEISKTDRPRLLLNNQIPGLREQLLSDPILQGAILPFAMKEVLISMFSEEFDETTWTSDWKEFVEDLCGHVFTSNEEDFEEDLKSRIIEDAVSAFVNQKRFGDNAKSHSKGATDD